MGTFYIIFWVAFIIYALFLGFKDKRAKSEDFKENSNIFLGAIIFVLIIAGIISLVFS